MVPLTNMHFKYTVATVRSYIGGWLYREVSVPEPSRLVILCILLALFLSVFALDVFGEGYGFWEAAQALLIHLIPTWIVLSMLAVAWRWGLVGAIMFPALGALYLAMFWGRFHWSAYAGISGPLLLIGVLFLVDWVFRNRSMNPDRGEG